ncbi:MAG: hypothetical protein ACKV19_10360 [Verrucomicrobiales bacterium]
MRQKWMREAMVLGLDHNPPRGDQVVAIWALPGSVAAGTLRASVVKRLARFLTSLIRWAGRQALTSAVIFIGLAIGWFGRKAVGPSLVSEQVGDRPAARPLGRPLPVVPTDPAARAWVEEAASLSSPSASLLKLRDQLEAGAISDFGRLARSLLCHPLPLFRSEAFASLMPAWVQKDPEGALRFLLEYQLDLAAQRGGPRDLMGHWASQAQWSWTMTDPAGAIRFLTPENTTRLGFSWEQSLGMCLKASEAPGVPSVADRLRLVAAVHGEAVLTTVLHNNPVLHNNLVPVARHQSSPSRAVEAYRDFAAEVTHPGLKRELLGQAMSAWREQNEKASPDEALAWLGDASPQVEAMVFSLFRDDGRAGQLLQSAAGDALPEWQRRQLFWSVLSSDPERALAMCQDASIAAWVDIGRITGDRVDLNEATLHRWMEVLPHEQQRTKLLESWFFKQVRTGQTADLTASVAQALAFAGEGESAAAIVMSLGDASSIQQVPEVFASLPAEVQSRLRLELVASLGKRAPDVAAELWMDATPEELGQPGVAVVAEEVAAKLLRRDPEVASAWIQQLPPGESRDRAVARMIERTAKSDPATCLEWAATIVDPPSQQRARQALKLAAPALLPP